MKHPVRFFIILIIAFILQITIFSFYPIAGVKPDILLVMVVTAGLLSGSKAGIIYGFMAGMIQDLFLGGMLGIYTIVKMVLGGLTGFGEGHFFKENIFIPPLIVFVLTVVHEIFVILLSENMIFNINYISVIQKVIFPEAVYNAILGFVFYVVFHKIDYSGDKYYG